MSVLVPIADGSEEIESVCIIDVLVRAGVKARDDKHGRQTTAAEKKQRYV